MLPAFPYSYVRKAQLWLSAKKRSLCSGPFFWDTTAQAHSKGLDEEHPLYLAVDSIGFLSSAAEQSPSFVLDIADVDIVAVALPKGDPGAPEHEQVVAVQYN